MAAVVRVVISEAHPEGAMWVQMPLGWAQAPAYLIGEVLNIDADTITQMDAELIIADHASLLIKAEAEELVAPQVTYRGCCNG